MTTCSTGTRYTSQVGSTKPGTLLQVLPAPEMDSPIALLGSSAQYVLRRQTVGQRLYVAAGDLDHASIQPEACCASLTWGQQGPSREAAQQRGCPAERLPSREAAQQRSCLPAPACRRSLELDPTLMQPACLQGACRSQS